MIDIIFGGLFSVSVFQNTGMQVGLKSNFGKLTEKIKNSRKNRTFKGVVRVNETSVEKNCCFILELN